ncbi:MAG: threonine-phosphate decarboxylase CobD [Pseudochelatococcus sp.]|jgi:cobalamin biosynthetic protein CobC|uniref:threonine-phosphate decarboxylase CobD n=1 Tax=Pseudochelatococcus sp. TaxID=2020869 RepID=UPI003D90C4CE
MILQSPEPLPPSFAEEKTAADAVADHGGNLARARALFPGAPAPWLDLSTGINPHHYPLAALPATVFSRLPEEARSRRLSALAAAVYGAPGRGADHVVPAAGTQLLLPPVAGLVPPGRAAVLSTTYAEHARAAHLAGHAVTQARTLAALEAADLAIVVNPNNPDGRVVEREALVALGRRLSARGGLLVVDEAFMDVGPAGASVAGDVEAAGIVVLRSFGKFFGLAGVRLGFAVAPRALAGRLSARLGPWAVSGPALEYGIAALGDADWQARMRVHLDEQARRLDALLAQAGLPVACGTSLFRYLDDVPARDVFLALGRCGVLVRAFDARPRALRVGLPADDAAFARLVGALRSWRSGA